MEYHRYARPAIKAMKKRPYERFGEVIRYLTGDELKQFFDAIDDYRHKLMFRVIYELGCRVGEFVRIQVKHVNFRRGTVFFPAENTKTHHARSSHLPMGLANELKSMLKQAGIISKRRAEIKRPEAFVFYPFHDCRHRYTENRIRQIFQYYIRLAGLQHDYGRDRRGRQLHTFTVHSLRHSHIMHYSVDRGLPLPIVQKQVGHRSLNTTSVYLSPSLEKMALAYRRARRQDNSEEPAGHTV